MSDDNPQFSQEEEDDGRTEPLGLTEFIVGNGTGVIDHNAVYDYEQQLGTIDEKRLYLMSLYDNIPPKEINKETMDLIGKFVRQNIVRNIKFVQNENICGLSQGAIDGTKTFPSYWKPDLTQEQSLQMDIFKEFPDIDNGTLYDKVQVWKKINNMVLKWIRQHRNSSQTAIQSCVVEGKYKKI